MRLHAQGLAAVCLMAGAFMCPAGASAAESVVRYKIPGSDFPIARAVEVKSDAHVLYVSGAVPPVVDSTATDSLKKYGNTETQTRGILQQIEKTLADAGYRMGDVVQMHAYLGPDPDTKKVDFRGFMKAYGEFFGTAAQPNLPARTTVPLPGMLGGFAVEIEVTAAK